MEKKTGKVQAPVTRLGVLVSGRGTNLDAILRAIRDGKLPGVAVAVVLSDVEEAPALEKARQSGVPALYLPPGHYKTRLGEQEEARYVDALREHGVDWVVLAGFMRVIKRPLLQAFADRIVNVHPSLLPSFRGLRAWEQALRAGVKITGCTVHLVNEELDGGRILMQAAVDVRGDDTPATLHARIQEQEHRLYPEALRLLTGNRLP